MNTYSNDSGAGNLFTFVAVFLLSAILFLTMGYALDMIVGTGITMGEMPSSQFRNIVIHNQILVWQFLPFIVLFGGGLNFIIAQNREYSASIPLGTMLIAVADLIISEIVIILFTIHGGTALETVVSTVAGIQWADTSMFGSVQHVLPVFYGIMFILTVAMAVLYMLTCIRVVDSTRQVI